LTSERDILESLDREIRAPRAAAFLSTLVSVVLKRDPAAQLAWRSMPLGIYDRLPGGIASS
jgi:hypothetical protein